MPTPSDAHVRVLTLSSAHGPALLIHGGAWDIPDSELSAHVDGLRQVRDTGRRLLEAGADAIDVVTEVVALMELHGAFDAGRGSVLTREGTVEMDAGIMCGARSAFGSAALLQETKHPIRLARMLLEAEHAPARFMAGVRADELARAAGLEMEPNAWFRCARERARHASIAAQADTYHTSDSFHGRNDVQPAPQGTVGCVARDVTGRLAAATSTGGTPFRPSGRVGDSPLPGGGFHADMHAAASATGWGEALAASMLCGRCVLTAHGHPAASAVESELRAMYARTTASDGGGARGGIILLTARGEGAVAWTTPRMARAAWAVNDKGFLGVD